MESSQDNKGEAQYISGKAAGKSQILENVEIDGYDYDHIAEFISKDVEARIEFIKEIPEELKDYMKKIIEEHLMTFF